MEAKGPLSGVADEGVWWPNFASNEDALDTLTKAIEASGHRAGEEVFISLDLAALNFRYRLSGDKPAWRPVRVFDDGRQLLRSEERRVGKECGSTGRSRW